MYKVVIICGGTGSIALQEGFAALYGDGRFQFKIIINAYDNGKSTGECRKVFGRKILGPSDLRKNHITQFKLKYEEQLKSGRGRESELLDLFELRFSADSAFEYHKRALERISTKRYITEDEKERFIYLLNYFFEKDGVRSGTENIDFTDFSLSNIFYASSAALHDYSLAEAGSEMAGLLDIEDNVLLVSDKSLFLQAETCKGKIIKNEADIVNWNNPLDLIKKVFLVDLYGEEYIPDVDEEKRNHDVEEAVSEADIIILSAGTQWSSLIPTYLHHRFKELLNNSCARKYLVMNNMEDGDMLGVDADHICSIIARYISLDSFKVIINKNAAESMNHLSGGGIKQYQVIRDELCSIGEKVHRPDKLVRVIMSDFYGKALSCKELMFDLDGTIWDERGNLTEHKIGKENLLLFPGIIVSGNSCSHVRKIFKNYCSQNRMIHLFADYGNTYFQFPKTDCVYKLTQEYDIDRFILYEIDGIDNFKGKGIIRGDVVLTVKPLENREVCIKEIDKILEKYNGMYSAKIAGKSSIDIMKSSYDKSVMIKLIINMLGMEKENVLFVGNEIKEGSETKICQAGIRTLHVNDVYECNVFLKTWHKYRNEG